MLAAGLLLDPGLRLVENAVDLAPVLVGVAGSQRHRGLGQLDHGVAEVLRLLLEVDLVGLALQLLTE